MTTSCGAFTITLDVKRAPKTTSSFASLARLGFYDGLTFHRVVRGDRHPGRRPARGRDRRAGLQDRSRHRRATCTTPAASWRWPRQEIEDPGTAGSQFFIVTGPDAQLHARTTRCVGRVTSGMDTVDRIAVLPTDPNTDAPTQPVVIDAMRVVKVKKK